MLVTNKTTADIYFGPLHLPAGGTLTVDDTSETSLYLSNDSVADALNNAYISKQIDVSNEAQPFPRPIGTPQLLHGSGNPEGLVYAPQGSVYMRKDGVQTNGGVLYMKTTGITLSTGWLDLATASGATAAIPPGVITTFGGATAPAGWLICDGTAILRSVYSLLFTAIGTNYGSGDGTTTFNLPDLQGRVAVGLAGAGGHVDVSRLGNSDGSALAGRRPRHRHSVVNPAISVSDPGHSHTFAIHESGANPGFPDATDQPSQVSTNSTSSSTTGISASASGGTVGPQTGSEPTDAPAYVVVNYIIKT